MIHQLIFASPKPGMTEQDFQRYWVEVHAVQYASKIKQIKRYLIDTRIPFGPETAPPLFSGVAEIWLANEAEQLASLQSKEFLEGARLDEPKWAAFWRTVVLDTNSHLLVGGPPPTRESSMVKLMGLVKRKAGMPLEEFRRYSLEVHGALDRQLPGLRRYLQCHVRDSFYAIGEAIFDAVVQLWFDDVGAIQRMMDSPAFRKAQADLINFIEPKYAHTFVTKEHWIIGPQSR